MWFWRCQCRGHRLPEKTLLHELKMAFISSVPPLTTLQENPPFQLFLWHLIYFWTVKISFIFLTLGARGFWNSAASKHTPHVAEEGTGSFPSIPFQDNHFQVSDSPVKPRWSAFAVRVYQIRPQSFFNHIPSRLSYLSEDKVFHPITGQGEEVRLAPGLSFKDALWRGTDAAQPILQEVLTFCRSKVERVLIRCVL